MSTRDNSLVSEAHLACATWASRGKCRALTAESPIVILEKPAQTPDSKTKVAILDTAWKHFRNMTEAFKAYAARSFRMHEPPVKIDKPTPTSVSGSRDAIGKYLLGLTDDPIYSEFSLEAQYSRPYSPGDLANSVGVYQASRRIPGIRLRQFNVPVTTPKIGRQAYEEI